MQDWKIKENR